MRKVPWIVCVATGLAFAGGGPAGAAESRWETFRGTHTEQFEVCGLSITSVVTFVDRVKVRPPRDPGAPPLVSIAYRVHETLTADGRSITIDRQGLFKEVRATRVEGTVYQFVTSELGQPFTVRDDRGRVVVHDRGVIATTFRLDTRGDADPENDQFIEGSQSVIADKGEHPGFYMDFCADIATPHLSA